MRYNKASKYLYVTVLIFLYNLISAQNIKQEKMEQLNFLIGEWVGTTKVYKNGVVTKEGSAYENISYDLDKSILVIELNNYYSIFSMFLRYDKKTANTKKRDRETIIKQKNAKTFKRCVMFYYNNKKNEQQRFMDLNSNQIKRTEIY